MKRRIWTAGVFAMASGLASGAIAQAENPDHVQRLLKTNQCPVCDLSGANLADTNLFGAALVGANLKGATLSGSNLGNANLSDADLTGAKLTQVYLKGAVLENTDLSAADLTGAYLRDATLSDAKLTRAILQGTNLSRTNLSGLDLRGVDLRGANLSHTILTGVRSTSSTEADAFALLGLTMQAKYLCETPLNAEDLESAKRSGFNIALANLSGANLSGTNLSGAILPRANLSGANLSGANLSGACLRNSNLTNATLDDADLKDARIDGAVLANASLKGVKNADLAETLPSQEAAIQKPIQAEAKQYVGSMNRAQQAYYLEMGKFATKLDELGLGIRSETNHYLYRIFAYADRQQGVMLASVPKQGGFKTYIGFVSVLQAGRNREMTTQAILCESEAAKPLLPKLPATVPPTGISSCPAGFVALSR